MNITNFKWDKNKCINCKKCLYTCPAQLFSFNSDGELKMKEVDSFGWDGCWKCQRCMAVCPTAAISILDKEPSESVQNNMNKKVSGMMDTLIRNRRSCRRYLDKNVDGKLIDAMLATLQNAPTGGNKQPVELTLIDNKETMKLFRDVAYKRMEELAQSGIYAKSFDKKSYEQMLEWQSYARPDALFCGAPHILIPHAQKNVPCAVQDVNIYCAYFELLCAANGLGAICMTYPLDVLNLMPDIKKKLQIPEDHYISMIIGFGYPEIRYARGVQREDEKKIKRIEFK